MFHVEHFQRDARGSKLFHVERNYGVGRTQKAWRELALDWGGLCLDRECWLSHRDTDGDRDWDVDEALGGRRGDVAAAKGEPYDEQREEACADGELEGRGDVGGRQECLEQAGNDEQRDGSGDELDGLGPGAGKGCFAGQIAGEEQAGTEAEAGGTSEEDAGQLKRAVRGDEAGERKAEAMLGAGRGDDAHLPAIVKEQKKCTEAEGDAGGEGEEAHGDVVGEDGARGLRLGGEDGLGPHAVVVDSVHHLRAEEGTGEVGPDGCAECAEQGSDDEQGKRSSEVGQKAADQAGVLLQQKAEGGGGADATGAAAVDHKLRAVEELVEIGFERGLAAERGGRL
jgi:hypothetical protein